MSTEPETKPSMRLIVVSGLSGGGKSVAMDALEDLGYYCMDNLPVTLLPAFAEEVHGAGLPIYRRVAVAIDARNPPEALQGLPQMVDDLRAKGLADDLVFLEAEDEVLIKRFSETRRKHPLTDEDFSLAEALRRERELLSPVRLHADICIDTSLLNLYQLRDLVRERIDRRPAKGLSLLLSSFGFKHGVPQDADMVFDVRCLPNPYWDPNLRSLSGRDPEVRKFLEAESLVDEMYQNLRTFLESWIPRFESGNRSYLTIAIGCTGGRHRSVYLVERLGDYFRERRAGVLVRHRDSKL